jgi:gliding motility-associated-like protein
VTIKDSNECVYSDQITINSSNGPVLSVSSQTNVSCYGGSDGSVTLIGSGSSGYSYSIDGVNFQPSGTFDNLLATTYTFTVMDGPGCTSTLNVTFTQPAVLTLNNTASTNVSCFNGSDGSVTVDASGGTSPYSYSIDGGSLTSNNTFTGLTAGNHTVTVQDDKGCTNTLQVTLTQPAAITTSVTSNNPASCGLANGSFTITASNGTGPYGFSLDGGAPQQTGSFSNVASGSHTVVVTDSKGCTKTVTVNTGNNPAPNVSAGSTVTICAGSSTQLTGTGANTYTWSPSAGLSSTSGASVTASPSTTTTYTVTGTNSNNCTDTASVIVLVNNCNPLVSTISGPAKICEGTCTEITALPSAGVPPYSYSWSTGQTTKAISVCPTDLTTYTVVVSDMAGESVTLSISTSLFPKPNVVAIASDEEICPGFAVTLKASGADSYEWSPKTGLSDFSASQTLAKPETAITYTVTGTDVNGCTSIDTVSLALRDDCGNLFVPNAFSPNNDGHNDLFQVYGSLLSLNISVFDRWGERVFETTDPSQAWDGTFRSKPMPSGVYVYYLEVTLEDGKRVEKKGNVSLIR